MMGRSAALPPLTQSLPGAPEARVRAAGPGQRDGHRRRLLQVDWTGAPRAGRTGATLRTARGALPGNLPSVRSRQTSRHAPRPGGGLALPGHRQRPDDWRVQNSHPPSLGQIADAAERIGRDLRSTQVSGKNILGAALDAVSTDAGEECRQERSWRFSYARHFMRSVELSAKSPEAALAVAQAGLDFMHERFEFVRDGKSCSLKKAMETFTGTFETGFVRGECSAAGRGQLWRVLWHRRSRQSTARQRPSKLACAGRRSARCWGCVGRSWRTAWRRRSNQSTALLC